jgi:biopolymer transport protein ExbD
MTPMVDVVLVILIFFMASTTFIGPEWLLRSALLGPPRPAPANAAAFSLPPARFELVLTTDAAGNTRIRGLGLDAASIDQAAARLADYADRLGPDRFTIVVSPDPAVPYRDVVRIHEVCASLGIGGVGLN